jgi:hypothetical protein
MTARPPLRVFIGYDSREPIAYHVLAHSILRRASEPVAIVPLALHSLRRFTRPRGPTETTEFSLSRFMVPFLCNFEGLAVFMDCDMLAQVDLNELWLPILADPGKAVWCVQHDYVPRQAVKMDGQPQTRYPRKNWSSFMVFDCAQCTALTPEYVNTATGAQLHRLAWTTDAQIGALPLDWNWLVGEYAANPDARILHYTNGGPWFPGCEACDQADRWLAARDAMLGALVAA